MAEEAVEIASRTDGSEGLADKGGSASRCVCNCLGFDRVRELIEENPCTVHRACRIAYRPHWNTPPNSPYDIFLCFFAFYQMWWIDARIVPVLDFCADLGRRIDKVCLKGGLARKNADGTFSIYNPTADDLSAHDWVVETIKESTHGGVAVLG